MRAIERPPNETAKKRAERIAEECAAAHYKSEGPDDRVTQMMQQALVKNILPILIEESCEE